MITPIGGDFPFHPCECMGRSKTARAIVTSFAIAGEWTLKKTGTARAGPR
jgi:hypothetical protein